MKFVYKDVVEYSKPYIIAEIGSNHNGDMELAKKMIKAAKDGGADCVKFQSWTKDSIFSKKTYDDNFFLADDYRNRDDYTLEQIVDKFHITEDDHRLLKSYCDELEIDFNSTPFSEKELNFLVDEMDVPFIKVASMDLNNIPFLKCIAKKNRPVVISTGLCPLSEIAEAVECLKINGCEELILMHCVAVYPTPIDDVNLNTIDMLRNTFGVKVGFSDHSLGVVAPIMALSKGVCIIEKHFTTDKSMFGWDHHMSIDQSELQAICDAARIGYRMLGSYNKIVTEPQERKDAFQRSIVAKRPIRCGEVISYEDIDFKRPGIGIHPKYVDFIIGKNAKRDIEYDEIIRLEDF